MAARAWIMQILSSSTQSFFFTGSLKISTQKSIGVFCGWICPNYLAKPCECQAWITTFLCILQIFNDICEKDMCDSGQCKTEIKFDQNQMFPVLTDSATFVSVGHQLSYRCKCRQGYAGQFLSLTQLRAYCQSCVFELNNKDEKVF